MSLRGHMNLLKAFASALIALSIAAPCWGADERVTLLCTVNLGELRHGAYPPSPKALKAVEDLLADMRLAAPDALIVDLGGFYGLCSPAAIEQGDNSPQEFARRVGYDALCLSARDVMLMGARIDLMRRSGVEPLPFVSNVGRVDSRRSVGTSVRVCDLDGKQIDILSIAARDRLSGVSDIDRKYRFDPIGGHALDRWARVVVTDASSSEAVALATDGSLAADLIIRHDAGEFGLSNKRGRFVAPAFSQDTRYRVPIVSARGCAGVLRLDVSRDSKGKCSLTAQFTSVSEDVLVEARKTDRNPAFLAQRVAGASLPDEQAADLVRRVAGDDIVIVSEWVKKPGDAFVCANDRVYGYSAYRGRKLAGRVYRVKQTSVDGTRSVQCLVMLDGEGVVKSVTFVAPPYVGGGFRADTERLLGQIVGKCPSSVPDRLEGMGGAEEFAWALVDQLRFLERMNPGFTGIESKR